MELVVKDAAVSITPTDPNKEMIVLKDATIVTNIKDPKNGNTIKIRPLKESVIEIEFGERRMS